MKLSEHFSFEELTTTSHISLLDSNIDEALLSPPTMINLKHLANTLEEIRTALGVPLKVTSGYRNNALNAKVGGSATSKHKSGLCADIVPIGIEVKDAFKVLNENRSKLKTVRKIIIEGIKGSSWLHIQTLANSKEKLELFSTNDGVNFKSV